MNHKVILIEIFIRYVVIFMKLPCVHSKRSLLVILCLLKLLIHGSGVGHVERDVFLLG